MSSRAARVVLLLLFAAHASLALVTARRTSVTVDEAGHIASGLAHHQQGNFASYRVNPPLARWLATLPIVAFQNPPTIAPLPDEPGRRPEGAYGAALATQAGPRYQSMVFVARMFNILLSTVGLLLVYLLGRDVFGRSAGILAAACYAFDPNLLAHAAVLTSDMPATTMMLASTWALVRYVRRPTSGNAFLAGALLGLAQLTKFSALVLYPSWIVVLIVAAVREKKLRTRTLHAVVIVTTSLVVLNAGYGFSGTGARLSSYSFVSASLSGKSASAPAHVHGNRFEGSAIGSLPVPLPRDYVLGIDLQRRDFEGRMRSYLDGTWHDRGFWFYYAYAFVLKTPLPVLALGLWAICGLVWRMRTWRSFRTEHLAVAIGPVAFFIFISSQTGFSHHLRYVLPVLPFFALAVGSLAPQLHSTLARWIVGVALVASATSVVASVPHQLSYFNTLAGGWQRGDERLVDSNIDWGQDLLVLKEWSRTRTQPLRLAYFGGVDPHSVGLEYTLPPKIPEPGRFVLSVNFVRGMRFVAVDGASRPVHLEEGRFAYFAQLEPTERIGTSIRVYDVTVDDARRMRRDMGLPD